MKLNDGLYVELTDPLGFKHYVLFDKDGVHGSENIAHVFEQGRERDTVRAELLELLPRAVVGTYRGYVWKHLA